MHFHGSDDGFSQSFGSDPRVFFLIEEEGVRVGVVGGFVSGVGNGWIWHRLDQD
jgi:hypothetical protein